MAKTIYVLCMMTSLICAVVLLRGWLRSRTRFLLWCSLCFCLLAANNLLLFIDEVLYPERTLYMFGASFAIWRTATALAGVLALCWGLIWDSGASARGTSSRGAP